MAWAEQPPTRFPCPVEELFFVLNPRFYLFIFFHMTVARHLAGKVFYHLHKSQSTHFSMEVFSKSIILRYMMFMYIFGHYIILVL